MPRPDVGEIVAIQNCSRFMFITKSLGGWLYRFRSNLARNRLLKNINQEQTEVALEDWNRSLTDPTGYYIDCFRFFHCGAPDYLCQHRAYFSKKRRGFGEDAFHMMWWMLFGRFRIMEFLEIGVYRGQTLSLAGLLQREQYGVQGFLAGISPFEPAGDSVSRYPTEIDYLSDTRKNFASFGLTEPVLFKGYSTQPEAVSMIHSRAWDCVYIDGSHDETVVKSDWQHSAEAVRSGGLIVLDDSALGTNYAPPIFASKGHPGPSHVANQIDSNGFTEILRVGHNRVFQKKERDESCA
jgi:hypothetical protein